MYLNIELRLPQDRIDSSMSKLFGLRLPHGATNRFKAAAADSYRKAYDELVKFAAAAFCTSMRPVSA
jgi:hypothetical protein